MEERREGGRVLNASLNGGSLFSINRKYRVLSSRVIWSQLWGILWGYWEKDRRLGENYGPHKVISVIGLSVCCPESCHRLLQPVTMFSITMFSKLHIFNKYAAECIEEREWVLVCGHGGRNEMKETLKQRRWHGKKMSAG